MSNVPRVWYGLLFLFCKVWCKHSAGTLSQSSPTLYHLLLSETPHDQENCIRTPAFILWERSYWYSLYPDHLLA
jgi:hypothetical protein